MMRSTKTIAALLLNAALAAQGLAAEACLRPVEGPGGAALRGSVAALIAAPGDQGEVLAGTAAGLFRIDKTGRARLVEGSEGRAVGPATRVPWRNEVAVWMEGEGLAAIGADLALRPLRPPPCASPLACHWQVARRKVGPPLLDPGLRPDRLVALPREQVIAVWTAGGETAKRISIEGGLAALVRGETPRGTPIDVLGTGSTLWVNRDALIFDRPNGSLTSIISAQGGVPPSGIAVFELPSARMLLASTSGGWASIRGDGIRIGINLFANRPPPMITAALDRGPQDGIWIGSPEGIMRLALADLLRPRHVARGQEPSVEPAILTVPAGGGQPGMGTVTALMDLGEGGLLAGARGGLFLLPQGGTSLSRHRPFAETGAVRAFHRWSADGDAPGPVLVEAERGLFLLQANGAVAPVAGSSILRGQVAAVAGTGRLFVPQAGDAPLQEVLGPGSATTGHDCTAEAQPAG